MIAARVRWGFDAIGTRWQIDTVQPLPAEVTMAVEIVIDRFDRGRVSAPTPS